MKKTILLLLVSIFALSFTACDSKKDAAKAKLEVTLATINKDCPKQIDDITTWTGCEIEDPYFIYNYEIDESAFEEDTDVFAFMEDQNAEFKSMLGEGLKQAVNIDETKQYLIDAGLGVRYHYTGSKSGKTMNFDFTPEEVAAL